MTAKPAALTDPGVEHGGLVSVWDLWGVGRSFLHLEATAFQLGAPSGENEQKQA